jgi:hypothetical protein
MYGSVFYFPGRAGTNGSGYLTAYWVKLAGTCCFAVVSWCVAII